MSWTLEDLQVVLSQRDAELRELREAVHEYLNAPWDSIEAATALFRLMCVARLGDE